MFSQACVKNSVHRWQEVYAPQSRHPLLPSDGHCSGRYTSYWSAFLLPPANEVWGKVIFLHLFVILFTGGLPHCMLGYTPQQQTPPEQTPPEQTHHPLGADTPLGSRHPPGHSACWEIRATSGRYASYWNVFLLKLKFYKVKTKEMKLHFRNLRMDRNLSMTHCLFCFLIWITNMDF